MAVDITLKVFNTSDTKRIECINLYFGKAIMGLFDGWNWVERQGMTVDMPNVLDRPDAKAGHIVSKAKLREWIEAGYLSSSPICSDCSAAFLNKYPPNAIFRLWFLDWS